MPFNAPEGNLLLHPSAAPEKVRVEQIPWSLKRPSRTSYNMKKIFFVDWNMCGGESLLSDFDLEEFCEVLQGKVSDVEIVPVPDFQELAVNRAPSLVSNAVFNEALGEYCHR